MEANAANTPQTPSPTVQPSVSPETPLNTNDTVSSPLLKQPMLWLGIGAIVIVILAYWYMSTGNTASSNQQKESTENVQIQPTGTIEIHEQTEADAIDVGNIDDDFTDIEKDVQQL